MKKIKLKSLLLREVTLYHGTTVDNVKRIERFGLIPSRGDFVSNAYRGEYDSDEDFENDVPELTFATNKKMLNKAITAATHHIAQKLDKDFHDVTDADFIQHGAIIIMWDGEEDFKYRDENDYNHPTSVEPGDYYSEYSVKVDDILIGARMVKFLRNYGLWPRSYGDVVMDKTKNYMRDRLIKLFISRGYPKEKVLSVIRGLTDKDLMYQYNKYKTSSKS